MTLEHSIICIALITLMASTISLGSYSPLSQVSSELELAYEAMEKEDHETVSNIILSVKNNKKIGPYVKGSFFMAIGQKYDNQDESQLGINVYKEILPLKSDLEKQGIFPVFYNSVLSLIANNYLVINKPKLGCEYGRQLVFEQRAKPVWRSYLFLATCEYMQSNNKQALVETKAAMDLLGQNDVARRQVLFTQAAIYQKLGRYGDAIEVLLEANEIEQSPKIKAKVKELRSEIVKLN